MQSGKKKTVLVTGGVRGIGLAIAKSFIQKGYEVYVTYSKDEESANKAREMGINVVCSDVKSEEDVKSLFNKFDNLDILVNNAGISLIKQIQDTTTEEFDELFQVNVRGTFLCAKYASQKMIAQKSGLIVNISSVWGEVGGSCESVYSASKAALLGFTKALAKELGYSGVRVCSVSPGVINTRMNSEFSTDTINEIVEEIPLGRIGSVEDIASAVIFLEENSYITGVDLPINGGFSVV